MEYTCPSTNRTETWGGWAPHLELPVKQDFGLGPQQHFNNEVNKDMVNFTEIESESMQEPKLYKHQEWHSQVCSKITEQAMLAW